MSMLREAGLEFVGVSSVRPSIAIVTDRNHDEIRKILKPIGLEIAISTKVDNVGLAIEHKK